MNPNPLTIADKNAGEWKEHPRFKGIWVKPLLTAAENSLANVNVVRVPPGKGIGSHTHGNQVETIYVIAGKSILTLNGTEVAFQAGQIIAVSSSTEHSLRNEGPEMLELLTVFTPPQ